MNGRQSAHAALVIGLWMVCGASLLGIFATFAAAWQRPVSALAGISLVSDTVNVNTSQVIRLPGPKYRDLDLQVGDYIVTFDGLSWQQAQRLNLHELPDTIAGELIPLTLLRGDALIQRSLLLTPPDTWEQVALMRHGITALLFWIPATLWLVMLT